MSLDGKLLRRAMDALESDVRAREEKKAAARAAAWRRAPAAAAADRKMRGLMAGAVEAAFSGGEADVERLAGENLRLQAERDGLLRAAGIRPEDIDDTPLCERCGDTGFIGARPCGCLLERYREAQRQELSESLKLGRETFATFKLDYYDDRRDPRTGVSPRENMRLVFESCRDYANNFGKNSVNLFLRGDTGLGKTFLSACIAKVVSEKGFSVVYETVVDILAAFEEEKFDRSDSAAATVRRYLNCDLLIVDDLGTEMTTSFSQSAIYTLVNSRLVAGKKTVINSNLGSADLARRYSPQIVSRLEGEYLPFDFYGRDIRLIKRESI